MDILALNLLYRLYSSSKLEIRYSSMKVLAYVMPVCAHVIDAGFIAAVIAVGSCFSCFPVYDRAAASSGKQLPTYRAPHHSTEQVDSSGGRMFYIPFEDSPVFPPILFRSDKRGSSEGYPGRFHDRNHSQAYCGADCMKKWDHNFPG